MSSHPIDSVKIYEHRGDFYFRIRCGQISTECEYRSSSINPDEVITCNIVDFNCSSPTLFDFDNIVKISFAIHFGRIINVMGRLFVDDGFACGGSLDDENFYRLMTPSEIATHNDSIGVLKSKGHNPNAKPYQKRS